MRVLSQFGRSVSAVIGSRYPAVEVVEVPFRGDVADGVQGDILLVHYDTEDETLLQLTRCGVRWAHFYSSGIDRHPVAAIDPAILLTCGRGASALPIAEFVLATMLAVEKDIPAVWASEDPANWRSPGEPIGVHGGELHGKVLGVVGLGAIGRRVAMLGQAFDMEVVGCRRRGGADVDGGYRVVDRVEGVLAVADHLVLAAALTPETHHLVDDRAVGLMKPGVHLVNVARGEMVDNEALIRGLGDGTIRWASLDVVDPEPLPEGHPLVAMDRVRISRHVAGKTDMAGVRHMGVFYDNLGTYLAGGELRGVVSRAKGY